MIPAAQHRKVLEALSIGSFAFTILLLYVSSALPLFDSSPDVLLPHTTFTSPIVFFARPLLRWDVFHFMHIAQEGYVYEYEWAFFPGAALVMKGTVRTLQAVKFLIPGTSDVNLANALVAGALASTLCGTTTTLYDLTLHYFGSPSMAFLTCLLSLLPSSPATLRFSVCNEPFFTYLSYRGILYCARSQWIYATLCFTLAALFRSNGIMLCIYILWGLLGESILTRRTFQLQHVLEAVTLTLTIMTPFLSHQYTAYVSFCLGTADDKPEWCSMTPPSIYAYVQDHYWNVGFMRYWTPSQLPNILLGVPPLLTIMSFSILNIRKHLLPRLFELFGLQTAVFVTSSHTETEKGLTRLSLAPHAVHALALSFLLLFAAHTQIALRLVASLPFTYWAAAHLLIEYPHAGKWWVTWSVVWGAISIVLWAVFLPPA